MGVNPANCCSDCGSHGSRGIAWILSFGASPSPDSVRPRHRLLSYRLPAYALPACPVVPTEPSEHVPMKRLLQLAASDTLVFAADEYKHLSECQECLNQW